MAQTKTVLVPVVLMAGEVEVLERTNPHLLDNATFKQWVNELVTAEIEFFEKEEQTP